MEKSLNEVLGEVFYELRKQKKLSQEKLAYQADVDRAFISDIERGVKQPSLNVIFRLAKVLDVLPSKILEKVQELYDY